MHSALRAHHDQVEARRGRPGIGGVGAAIAPARQLERALRNRAQRDAERPLLRDRPALARGDGQRDAGALAGRHLDARRQGNLVAERRRERQRDHNSWVASSASSERSPLLSVMCPEIACCLKRSTTVVRPLLLESMYGLSIW